MKKLLYLTIVFFATISGQLLAQTPLIPPPPQFDPDVVALVDIAKAQMDQGDYEEANKTFRRALATKKVLPTSMSYFFAKTLFVIHQNQNARNFVDKYIELAGRGGDYYDDAVKLKELIDIQFEEIKNCEYCNLSGYRYVLCDNCNGLGRTVEVCYYCNGHGTTSCPKCMGRGVIITTDQFGKQIYSSCDLCDSKGYITCPVCHGEGELSGICSVCLGTGKKVSNIICNHQPEQN
jgi:DnaJ-class molecular chaperone